MCVCIFHLGTPQGWLTSCAIDAVHAILTHQFPLQGGLQPCIYAARPCFRPTTHPIVQIINTQPSGRGVHWICLSTHGCEPGSINVYDSAKNNHLSSDVERCSAQLVEMPQDMDSIKVYFIDCDQQRNSMDCGVSYITYTDMCLHLCT